VAVNGARNAGLLAVRILAVHDPALAQAMESFQADLAAQAREQDATLSGGRSE
jgi:5-(carboxyamino)imidazole ribonucleotide mutase